MGAATSIQNEAMYKEMQKQEMWATEETIELLQDLRRSFDNDLKQRVPARMAQARIIDAYKQHLATLRSRSSREETKIIEADCDPTPLAGAATAQAYALYMYTAIRIQDDCI